MISLQPILHNISQNSFPDPADLTRFSIEAGHALKKTTSPIKLRQLRLFLNNSLDVITGFYRANHTIPPYCLESLSREIDALKHRINLPEVAIELALRNLQPFLPDRRNSAPIELVQDLHTSILAFQRSLDNYPDDIKGALEQYLATVYLRYDTTFGLDPNTIRYTLTAIENLRSQGRLRYVGSGVEERSKLETKILYTTFLPRGTPPQPHSICSTINNLYGSLQRAEIFEPLNQTSLEPLIDTFRTEWENIRFHPYPPIAAWKDSYQKLISLNAIASGPPLPQFPELL